AADLCRWTHLVATVETACLAGSRPVRDEQGSRVCRILRLSGPARLLPTGTPGRVLGGRRQSLWPRDAPRGAGSGCVHGRAGTRLGPRRGVRRGGDAPGGAVARVCAAE